jgi:putative ABC transport system ATP-binding protein
MVLAKMSRRERQERTLSLLERVDLADRAHHYPGELSGGQQQRVAVARALANNPPILIGDEVTGDLDSESGQAIMRLLAELNEEGMTIVFVTHDPRMARFARRMIQIYDGKLALPVPSGAEGSEAEVPSNEGDPYPAGQVVEPSGSEQTEPE